MRVPKIERGSMVFIVMRRDDFSELQQSLALQHQ
jgi:hypothetical protein